RLDAGSAFGNFSPSTKALLDLYMVAGHYADTNAGGISLGLLGGLESAPPSSCVPPADPPVAAPIPMSPVFDGNVNPTDNQPFDVGLGFHKTFLERGAFAAWQSGALCLGIGTRSVSFLSSGTFSLLAPSMDDLAHGVVQPMFLSMRPQKPPQVT